MKKIFTHIVTGLFLVGVTGIAQAQGYYAGIDFQIEGPSYNYASENKPITPTVVVLDQGSRYIEGIGFALRTPGLKTLVSKAHDHRDWCCEGLTEVEVAEMHIRQVNRIEPAAAY